MNNKMNLVQAMQLPVNRLRPFEGHPFQVKDDAEMEQLVWKIKSHIDAALKSRENEKAHIHEQSI